MFILCLSVYYKLTNEATNSIGECLLMLLLNVTKFNRFLLLAYLKYFE